MRQCVLRSICGQLQDHLVPIRFAVPENTPMADPELSFFRWARLRDFSEMGLALRGPDIKEYIREGYMERNATEVILTAKGNDALKHEPAV
jgi:hypothetical protein